jgi:hypothetical protein
MLLSCLLVACSGKGGEGQPCKCDNCTILSGSFTCDPGLVCNRGPLFAGNVCQKPHIVPEGGACSDDENCAEGLYCMNADRCAQKGLSVGEACDTARDLCGSGLVCMPCSAGTKPICAPAGGCPDAGEATDGDAGGQGG